MFPVIACEKCVCRDGTCVDDDGASTCHNYHSRVVCQDRICQNSVGCDNRFVPIFSFDLIQTRVGFGVAARRPIPANVFLLEFVGELIYDDQVAQRPSYNLNYMMALPVLSTTGRCVLIDPTLLGNESRFVNHSCTPNCEYRVYHCGKQVRVGLFSTEPVRAGAELTVNYRPEMVQSRSFAGATHVS